MTIAFVNNDTIVIEHVDWRAQSASQPYSLSVADGAYRFEIRSGDHWPLDPDDGRQRSELSSTRRIPYGSVVDATFALKIEPGPVTDRHFLIPFQIHTDDTMKVSPVLALDIHPNKSRASENLAIDLNDGTKARESHRTFEAVPVFTRGVVHRFHVVFVDSHGAPGGRAKVWMDGRMIVDFAGRTGFAEAVQSDYAKFGIYAGPAVQAGDTGIVSSIVRPIVRVSAQPR